MKILKGLEGLCSLPTGTAMTIGNFDGLHIGHQHLISQCQSLAAPTSAPVAVVTFEPHPLTVLNPQHAPRRLSTAALKRRWLEQAGVDFLVELPPSPEILNLSALAFWQLLCNRVRPTDLVEGLKFTFGKDRGGDVTILRQWAENSSIRLHVIQPVSVVLLDLHVVAGSSSFIRWLLTYGRVRDAAIALGRPYTILGQVIRGHQRGRTLGFPTANFDCGDQLIPIDGVYAARGWVGDRLIPAAVSIGTMPTFGQLQRQVEAHFIDFSGDLYGQTLSIEIIDWLRDQHRFDSPQSLIQQMHRDVDLARQLATMDPARAIATL